jgi:hypothetical protein
MLVPARDVGALSAAIDAFLADPSSGTSRARTALERVRQYDLARVLGVYERLYAKALALQPRAQRSPT